ncbi:class I SAM-dependent methyltransferase [Actinospica sp. MGRD01-02]|uniref:Class I SAM-dependent methyltransferase n=1 Tax=Actinospica acidithermotolerans TaxID=2828514 RepID=A0A941EFY6_9ACTN|nr:class I SAM-dependent methyltransferase [Actinospica acidithermotolerans]MBR7830746.1 class I SAM-dependent methyltransferase [Actinospica acidithermotolerans]
MTSGGRGDGWRRRAELYDRLAPCYDVLIAPFEKLLLADARLWAARIARGRTLEIGTGTGRTLAELRHALGAQAPAPVGVDVSLGMLTRAAARTRALRATVIAADAARLPLAAATIDTAVSTLTLCAMPEPLAVLTEVRRVLRPDGQLVLIEHSTSSWRAIAALQRLLEHWTAPRFGEHLTREPEVLAAQAGFTIVHSEARLGGIVRRVIARPH